MCPRKKGFWGKKLAVNLNSKFLRLPPFKCYKLGMSVKDSKLREESYFNPSVIIKVIIVN